MNALEQINSLVGPNRSPQLTQSPDALQKAARQFEAILLMQLTSALNGTNESDDEDSLFGSDGGSSLAKQMFSEQMATTMADSGGIGLSDMIMQKFGLNAVKGSAKKADGLVKMMTAIKDIRDNSAPATLAGQLRKNNSSNSAPLINRSARAVPIPDEPKTGDANEPTIVSTYADRLAEQSGDDTISPLFREEKVYAATRPRRVGTGTGPAIEPETPRVPPVTNSAAVSQGVSGGVSQGFSRAVAYNFPVRGRISSGFGNRFHPIDKVAKFHAGLDIAVPKGTRVDAAAEGTVVFAGPKGGYGNLVIIRHPDGKESRYGHLEKILVSEGDQVDSRQQIALSGSTGKSTGPHLHFEIRENGQVVNPLKFLSNVLPKSADR